MCTSRTQTPFPHFQWGLKLHATGQAGQLSEWGLATHAPVESPHWGARPGLLKLPAFQEKPEIWGVYVSTPLFTFWPQIPIL